MQGDEPEKNPKSSSGNLMRDMMHSSSAIKRGDVSQAEELLNSLLSGTISILDTNARKPRIENFYHDLLQGLFAGTRTWLCRLNAESGDGFSDILKYTDDPDQGIIIEVKYSDSPAGPERDAQKAITQIKERNYTEKFRSEGIYNIMAYGIAFFWKRCRIALESPI